MTGHCSEYREKIAALLAGDLAAGDVDDVERHLDECPGCRGYQQALQKDDSLLSAFVDSVDDTLERLEETVMRTIDIEMTEAREAPANASGWDWRAVVQSRITKVAAAAIVLVSIALSINLFDGGGGSNMLFADVLRQVEEASDFIARVRQDQAPDADLDMVEYRSSEYGLRVDMYRRDTGKLGAVQYLRPGERMLYVLIHRDRAYATVELTDEQYEGMFSQNNAKEFIEFFKEQGYEEIGRKKIEGKIAQGFEVKDPEALRSLIDECTIRLWVDIETSWPVMIEMEGTSRGGKVRIKKVMDRFQWNPSLSAEDFEFEIPAGYTNRGKVGAVKGDEESALAGLKNFASFSDGRYPTTLTLVTALNELDGKLSRGRKNGTLNDGDLGKVMSIQDACTFYAELEKQDRDAKYYGDDVGPRDFDRVLMRWRLDDGRYRVVYGDLRTEDVSETRLRELEGND